MQIETVNLKAENIDIVGQLYLPAGKAPYPTVCACHGIPAGAPEPNDRGYTSLAEYLCAEGLAAFIFNFRGTGASGGNIDMPGWAVDLEAALDYLSASDKVDKSRLWLLGFSGGAAVSVYVAAKDSRVKAVVGGACPAAFGDWTSSDPLPLIERFRDIGAIRDSAFPASPQDWLDGFRRIKPLEYVGLISPRPLLLVHGDRDDVVSLDDAYRLYAGAGEPKELAVIEGAGHRLRHDEKAMKTILDWLKAL
ncbi:MAG: alpha/beta fold hydrolase [Dehalococcoidia bacterium]|jgi:dipeptidyl aminopeptidase/acylaminoacyl peptidase